MLTFQPVSGSFHTGKVLYSPQPLQSTPLLFKGIPYANQALREAPLKLHSEVNPHGLSEFEIRQLVEQAFQEAQLAQQSVRHFKERYYGSAVLLDTGEVLSASNVPFEHDDSICSERNVLQKTISRITRLPTLSKRRRLAQSLLWLGQAWSRPGPWASKVRSIHYFIHQLQEIGGNRPPKILAMATSTAEPLAKKDRVSAPCGTCLQSLQSTPLLRPDTLMLTVDFQNGSKESSPPLLIQARTLKQFLPFKEGLVPSFSEVPPTRLPLRFSPKAQEVLAAHGGSADTLAGEIQKTMETAHTAYEQAIRQERSARNNQYAGCGILFMNPATHQFTQYAGSNLHATSKFYVTAVQDAVSNMLHEARQPVGVMMSGLLLVGYVSKTDTLARRMEDLSFLYKLTGRKDILIATLENDTLQVRTLEDCAPILYTKGKDRNGKG